MSTILDALKKLEAEKRREAIRARRTLDENVVGVDQDASDLDMESPRRSDNRVVLIAGGIATVAVLVAIVSVSTAVLLMNRSDAGMTVAAAPTTQTETPITPAPAQPAAPSPSAPEPVVESPAAAAPVSQPVPQEPVLQESVPQEIAPTPAPEPAAPAAMAAPEPAPVAASTPEPVSEPEPVVEQPVPTASVQEPIVVARNDAPTPPPRPENRPAADPDAPIVPSALAASPPPAPRPQSAAPAPADTSESALPPPGVSQPTQPSQPTARDVLASSSAPMDISSLPIMGDATKRRHGLGDLRLNMPRPQNHRNPRPSAVFRTGGEMYVVYEGEEIPGAGAVLIGVASDGVAIQLPSGDRYFMSVW